MTNKDFDNLILHHEFDSLDRNRGIFVDQRQITRRQVGEFPAPSRVGNFHTQNTVGKAQRPSPLGHRTATGDGPSQQRALPRRPAPKSFDDDGFEAVGSTVQDVTSKVANAIRKAIGGNPATIVASENVASLQQARAKRPLPWRAFWQACAGASPNTDFPGSAPPRTSTALHPRHRRGCSRRSIPPLPQYRAAR